MPFGTRTAPGMLPAAKPWLGTRTAHMPFGLAGEPGAWEAFEAVLRSPLPVAFRFTGWGAAAHALRDAMETEHAAACLAASGRPLPWYPDRLAWQASKLTYPACNPAGPGWHGQLRPCV